MIVANYITNRPTMGDTRTYEDFYKFLGGRPHYLGVLSRMYPENTAAFITEAVGNIFHMDKSASNKFQPIDSMYFELTLSSLIA